MADSKRLDVAMTTLGLVESRSRAGSVIKGGGVYVNGKCCKKASTLVSDADRIEIQSNENRFVSRGGYKLLKALETFPICLEGLTCMDVGASTGGFTDCMLQFGAKRVYSVDVGTDQLAQVLRQDPRVICKEQCNFRYATKDEIPEGIDFASVDVSFISLEKILPTLFFLLKDKGTAVCLIKPQFEAGKENLSKNGVVRNANVHRQVLHRVISQMNQVGFRLAGLTYSPIKGPQGNIEYLAYITKDQTQKDCTIDFETFVKTTYRELGDKH